MRYHDFTLEGYSVLEKGRAIVLNLKLESNSNLVEESHIKFSGVTLYNFIHMSGSIITDIIEVEIKKIVTQNSIAISDWNQICGVEHYKENINEYINSLIGLNLKAWEITSAIGFYGFVIAKSVENA